MKHKSLLSKQFARSGMVSKMTITYSLWDGAQLLGAGLTANSADEMNKVVADLQKVSVNVVAHMRKVSQ